MLTHCGLGSNNCKSSYRAIPSRIGVGAQSTLGQDIFARKYKYEKLTKCPNFTWYLPENVHVLHDDCPKSIPDFFSLGGGRNVPSLPPSPTPMTSRLYVYSFYSILHIVSHSFTFQAPRLVLASLDPAIKAAQRLASNMFVRLARVLLLH